MKFHILPNKMRRKILSSPAFSVRSLKIGFSCYFLIGFHCLALGRRVTQEEAKHFPILRLKRAQKGIKLDGSSSKRQCKIINHFSKASGAFFMPWRKSSWNKIGISRGNRNFQPSYKSFLCWSRLFIVIF